MEYHPSTTTEISSCLCVANNIGNCFMALSYPILPTSHIFNENQGPHRLIYPGNSERHGWFRIHIWLLPWHIHYYLSCMLCSFSVSEQKEEQAQVSVVWLNVCLWSLLVSIQNSSCKWMNYLGTPHFSSSTFACRSHYKEDVAKTKKGEKKKQRK